MGIIVCEDTYFECDECNTKSNPMYSQDEYNSLIKDGWNITEPNGFVTCPKCNYGETPEDMTIGEQISAGIYGDDENGKYPLNVGVNKMIKLIICGFGFLVLMLIYILLAISIFNDMIDTIPEFAQPMAIIMILGFGAMVYGISGCVSITNDDDHAQGE